VIFETTEQQFFSEVQLSITYVMKNLRFESAR